MSLCTEFLCFERLGRGMDGVQMQPLITWYHSISVQHLSLHILLGVVAVEALLAFLQVTTEIVMPDTLKGARPTRNTDTGQPGHLCLLFMDLSLNRVPWKASWFSYACGTNIWFTGRHVKISAFWETSIQTAIKVYGWSATQNTGRELQGNWGWRGLERSLVHLSVRSPTHGKGSSETRTGLSWLFAVMSWKLPILAKHQAMSASFLLIWVYQEAEMQVKEYIGCDNAQFGCVS